MLLKMRLTEVHKWKRKPLVLVGWSRPATQIDAVQIHVEWTKSRWEFFRTEFLRAAVAGFTLHYPKLRRRQYIPCVKEILEIEASNTLFA